MRTIVVLLLALCTGCISVSYNKIRIGILNDKVEDSGEYGQVTVEETAGIVIKWAPD